MARPQKEIDAQQVVKLAQLGVTHAEMADFFGCDRATIERRFAAEIAKGKAEMRFKLRRLQLRAAERGSAAMLIFLGKTVLGQKQRDDEAPTAVFFTLVPPDGTCPHCTGSGEDPNSGGKCLLCNGAGIILEKGSPPQRSLPAETTPSK